MEGDTYITNTYICNCPNYTDWLESISSRIGITNDHLVANYDLQVTLYEFWLLQMEEQMLFQEQVLMYLDNFNVFFAFAFVSLSALAICRVIYRFVLSFV